jgi:hypothetical protein
MLRAGIIPHRTNFATDFLESINPACLVASGDIMGSIGSNSHCASFGARCAACLCVKVGNPFNSIATDPVKRMIRVHAKSIAKARKRLRCDCVAIGPCDPNQCRIVVNALRREIDRLVRGIDRFALCYKPRFADTLNTRCGDEARPRHDNSSSNSTQLASATHVRKSYAVASLGPPLAPDTIAAVGDASANHLNTDRLRSGENLIDFIA